MKYSSNYEEKRYEILDKIIDLREEYKNCYPKEKEGELPRPFIRSGNEVSKYASTLDPQPSIPQRYLVDLAENLPVHMKINSLICLIDRAYSVTDQEREFLYSIEKDYKV